MSALDMTRRIRTNVTLVSARYTQRICPQRAELRPVGVQLEVVPGWRAVAVVHRANVRLERSWSADQSVAERGKRVPAKQLYASRPAEPRETLLVLGMELCLGMARGVVELCLCSRGSDCSPRPRRPVIAMAWARSYASPQSR
eukprot:2602741-Rhodomonas_salina.1